MNIIAIEKNTKTNVMKVIFPKFQFSKISGT
jgi:hypothetical protein